MANSYEDTKDIQFQIEHCIDWEAVIPLTEQDFADGKKFKETNEPALEYAPNNTEEAMDGYRTIYEAFGQIVADELKTHTQTMDQKGLKLEKGKVTFPEEQTKFFDTLRDAGLLAYAHERKYGGSNLGFAARMPLAEMTYGADIGTGIIQGYFNMAEVISGFASEEIKNEYLPRFGKSKIIGAMALTEPNYGSDLSQIQTKAVEVSPGVFEITGTKRFITQGCGFGEDVPAAIFTIARSTSGAGARGISFFLVETKDVEVARLEDKMGLHASATCELVYDKSKGLLIGEEGKGLVKYAIALMNGARLGIACQSLGVAQAALEQAVKYASERVQFGDTINKLPAVKRLLAESDARVQVSRALVYRTSMVVDMLDGLTVKMEKSGKSEREIRKDPEVMKWDKLAKILTPTAKLTTSEFAIKVAYDGVQVHGGVGYTEEFEIAKIYRDARISTIYEGTSQLQSVAIIGGVVEGVSENSVLYKYMSEETAKIKDGVMKSRVEQHWNELISSVAKYKELDKDTRASAAWDISWHWCFVFTEMLLAQQTDIAREKGLNDFIPMKEAALKTYNHIADREIAGFVRQIENFASE